MNRFGAPPLTGIFISGMAYLPACLSGVALLAMLVACNRPDTPGQPVAHVNGKPITLYQLGDELGRNDDVGRAEDGRGKALQELIDRELLQAEAVRSRIDRDPHVAAALENARTQILAQAYLQSRVAYVRAPSRDEVRTYFDKHPEKFSRRKLFHVKEIILPAADVTDELKSAMDTAKTLDDMSAWLDGRRIAHSQGTSVQSSTDLPDSMLARMQGMQVGQIFMTNNGNSASLLSITDILESPLGFDAASPQIERMLLARKGRELGESKLERLRVNARVEYADDRASRLASSSKDAVSAASEKIVKASGRQSGAE